ncbi:MAG: hypothetical protein HKN73_18180, partial [Gemmatimonadetes bacterium]|nr:hypothetical protein [Gemmatimonadota bacterium]
MPPNDPTRGEGPGDTHGKQTPADRPGEEGPVAGVSELYGDASPPPGLEGRVVAGLRAGGLLGTTWDTGRRSGVRWPLRAAAALVLFAAGWGTRGAIDGGAALPETRGTEDYMLLVYGDA